jgi:hypothetical protein
MREGNSSTIVFNVSYPDLIVLADPDTDSESGSVSRRAKMIQKYKES